MIVYIREKEVRENLKDIERDKERGIERDKD
jgi:hypothetical protein